MSVIIPYIDKPVMPSQKPLIKDLRAYRANLPLLPVCMQSTPSLEVPSFTCRDLILASVSIGLRPEFSARAMGMASRASANERMAYCWRPGSYGWVIG